MRAATWNQVFIAIVSRQRQCKFIGDTSNWLERSTCDVPSRFYAAYLSHESKSFTRGLFQTNFEMLPQSARKILKNHLFYYTNSYNQFQTKYLYLNFIHSYFLQTRIVRVCVICQ